MACCYWERCIARLFDKSVHTHQLSADLKKARVTPIYKGNGEVINRAIIDRFMLFLIYRNFLRNVSITNNYCYSILKITPFYVMTGGGPRVVVSTAAFHAGVRGSVPGLGG